MLGEKNVHLDVHQAVSCYIDKSVNVISASITPESIVNIYQIKFFFSRINATFESTYIFSQYFMSVSPVVSVNQVSNRFSKQVCPKNVIK